MKLKQAVYIGLGGIFLILGIIGIFIPGLPTTPFLLLTAFFFNKGSEKFHNWLMQHPILSPPILDWQQKRVIRTKFKILATVVMLISLAVISSREAIPLLGKASFGIFIFLVLLFIWKQKGKSD